MYQYNPTTIIWSSWITHLCIVNRLGKIFLKLHDVISIHANKFFFHGRVRVRNFNFRRRLFQVVAVELRHKCNVLDKLQPAVLYVLMGTNVL